LFILFEGILQICKKFGAVEKMGGMLMRELGTLGLDWCLFFLVLIGKLGKLQVFV